MTDESEKEYVQIIAERLDAVQPKLRDEPNAYKRAVIRMAICEHLREEAAIMEGAMFRHG